MYLAICFVIMGGQSFTRMQFTAILHKAIMALGLLHQISRYKGRVHLTDIGYNISLNTICAAMGQFVSSGAQVYPKLY